MSSIKEKIMLAFCVKFPYNARMRRNRTLYLDDDLLEATASLGKKKRHSLSVEIEEALKGHLERAGFAVPSADDSEDSDRS